MGLYDDNDGVTFTAIILCIIFGLGWCAVQVLSIVQGARFLSAFCNQDLAIYLLTSGLFPLALALASGAASYLQSHNYNAVSRGFPKWRLDFIKKKHHETIQMQRIPTARWSGKSTFNNANSHNLPAATPIPRDLVAENAKPFPLRYTTLQLHPTTILPPALPTEQVRYKAPLGPGLRQATSRTIGHSTWLPPRSTCAEIFNTTGCTLRRYATPEDQPPFASPMDFPCQPDQHISQYDAQQRWRKMDQNYFFNAIYSTIHIDQKFTAGTAWKCLKFAVFGVGILLSLASVGWLIFGTVITSKSGVGRCEAELYRTALAVVVINWSTPLAFGVIVLFGILCL